MGKFIDLLNGKSETRRKYLSEEDNNVILLDIEKKGSEWIPSNFIFKLRKWLIVKGLQVIFKICLHIYQEKPFAKFDFWKH